MPAPFWSGKNAKVLFFVDGSQVVLDVTSWSVKANVTDVNDGVCGEDRDRLQTITNFYDIQLTCKQRGTDDLQKLLDNSDNDDSNALPLEKALAFSIKPNDGTSAAYQASGEIAVGAWDWSSGGRSERQTLTIPIRAQYFTKLNV